MKKKNQLVYFWFSWCGRKDEFFFTKQNVTSILFVVHQEIELKSYKSTELQRIQWLYRRGYLLYRERRREGFDLGFLPIESVIRM